MKKSIKRRGSDFERDLVNLFWQQGFAVLRAPSSGGATKMPRPDILAGNARLNLIFAIELKTTRSDKVYLDGQEIDDLIEFSTRFGATPLVAVKFINARLPFIFLKVNDLHLTPKGNYAVSKTLALRYGTKFEELTKGQQQSRL